MGEREAPLLQGLAGQGGAGWEENEHLWDSDGEDMDAWELDQGR